jgi:hypothetical protein
MAKDRRFLVEQMQPFGDVKEERAHPGQPSEGGFSSKPLGDLKQVRNYGIDQSPPSGDHSASAKRIVAAHKDDPFFWVRK